MLTVVVVLALLVLAAAAGTLGRPPERPSTREPVAVATAPAPSRSNPAGSPLPAVLPTGRASPRATQAAGQPGRLTFAVTATLGRHRYVIPLDEAAPGILSGSFDVPIPPPATRGDIALHQVLLNVSHHAWTPIGEWELRLESLSAASGRRYVVLDESIRGRPNPQGVPDLARTGYAITVSAQSGVDPGAIQVTVRTSASTR